MTHIHEYNSLDFFLNAFWGMVYGTLLLSYFLEMVTRVRFLFPLILSAMFTLHETINYIKVSLLNRELKRFCEKGEASQS